MRLQILHIHDCPSTAELETLLVDLVGSRPDVEISRRLVEDDEQAAMLGMTGSPTLLIDGADPLPGTPDGPRLACRLYPRHDGRLSGVPPLALLRQALARADALRGPAGLDPPA